MDFTIITIVLTLASTAWSASPLCYWPGGGVAVGQFPCGTSGHSTCCGTGYACLSNHMCQAVTDEALIKGPLYARGACTDSFWESPNCPPFCKAVGYDVMDGQQVMHKCDNSDRVFYCESSAKPDCEHTKKVIVESTKPTAQTTITATMQSLETTATGASTATSASSTSTSTSTAAGGGSSDGNGAKIGIGVGVTLGGLGLMAGLLALFLVKRRRGGRRSDDKSEPTIPVQELPADPLPPASVSMPASPPPPTSSPPPAFWPSDCKTPFPPYTPSSMTTLEPWSPNLQELPGH
ncbi:hypothetical protein JDV02_006233 [Purpureocillium takamizusanense]|uniref:Uncharacterized protein n=1 Tax=Purpureocillium takamizusanense TaxID=2060973 RepID=A0A9Q8QJ40_9HYPO|nr:uncharacterized protein JDV02_006233 [Purpureocillium takamizusanense]UNI20111.1 hypothetical protein JDV02_006233 [Purpureocillium takamizusanense]